MRSIWAALLFVSLGVAGCGGSNKVGQCNATNECPSGEVCQNKVCAKTCDTTTVCPGGYSCQNGLCVTGATGAPEIASVSGMSTETCEGGTPCIGAGFVVAGSHLSNTTFTITGPDGDSTSYEMKRVNNSGDDSSAELTPVFPRRKVDFTEGRYVLTAVNQAGSDTSNVQLLRGEAGPALTADQIIDKINTASTGKKIQAPFLDVVGGGGSGATGTLVTYEKNPTLATPSDGLTGVDSQLQLREMRVIINGLADGPNSLAINEAKLEELCADRNGCSITLGATRFRDNREPSYVIDAPINGGECRFYLDTARHSWTLSQECVAVYGLYRSNQANTAYEFDRAYQRYEYGNTYGLDGSGNANAYDCLARDANNVPVPQSGDADGVPLIVASFKGGCYLTEAPPDTSKPAGSGCFTPDNGVGFYLIASHPSWDYTGAYPKADNDANGDGVIDAGQPGAGGVAPRPWPTADTARQCVLTIKD